MKITIETIFALVSAVGVVGGIIAWWLGRILDDRKDSIEQAMKINYLEKEMEDIKKDIADIQHWYNNGRNN
jgi:membrane protein YqaA with SNARE-associated domain